MSAPVQSKAPKIGAHEVKRMIDAGDPVTILDARSPNAYDGSDERIGNDVRVDPQKFQVDQSWPKDRPIVVYCT